MKEYITPLIGIIIIGLLVYFNSCQKETTVLERNPVLEQKIDSISKHLSKVDTALKAVGDSIAVKEYEIKNIYNVYKQKDKQILSSPVDTNLNNRLREYYYSRTDSVRDSLR